MFRRTLRFPVLLICFAILLSQGICFASAADTSVSIVRGTQLLELSPVCYYYDSLCNSGVPERGDLVAIAYMPAKETWEVYAFDNEDERTANPIVRVENNFMELSTSSGSMQSATTQAKLLYDAKGNPILCVSYIHYGNPHVIYTQFGFYRLGNKGWNNVTSSVIKLPDTSAYFGKPINTKLARKYGYVGVDATLSSSSDTIVLSAFQAFDIHCENKTVDPLDSDIKMSAADKSNLCTLFDDDSANGDGFTKRKISFVYNKASGKFKRVLLHK